MFNVENIVNPSAALYIRLSSEDKEKQNESESVTNQRSILLRYAKTNNIRVYDIYIDDGFTGTNFDRPSFKRMIDDIESKKVNIVITKDMSRLGRDYIVTGELMEKYFPSKGVRYIAINDGIDTFIDNGINEITPFKAVINDYYARDISKKIRSSLQAKMKDGKFVGGRTPYGYDKDPKNKNHLVINKEQAIVVKRIYNLALSGLTAYKIASLLTKEKIKTPAQHYDFDWRANHNYKYGIWHSSTVKDILTNRIYTGDLIQNKRRKVNYKVKKIVYNNPNEHIIIENTHEAIIDKETFNKVQKLIPKNVGRNEKKEHFLLEGLLYCGDCGHRISVMPRKKNNNLCYTDCNYNRTYRKEKLCTPHCNNYDKLEAQILSSLKEICLKYIDRNKIVKEVNNKKTKKKEKTKDEILIISNRIDTINNNLDEIYMDKLNKVIDEDRFIRIKSKFEKELSIALEEQKRLLDNNKNKISEKTEEEKINKYINEFLKFDNIDRDLIVNLIDKIEIFENKKINIKLTFGN